MRRFYEAWKDIEVNSVVPTTELQQANNESDAIKGLSIFNWLRPILSRLGNKNASIYCVRYSKIGKL